MGQKYAAFNNSGMITAFYDSVDSPVPSGVATIPITDSEWQTCLSQPGWTVENGSLVAPPTPTTAQLLAQAQSAQIALLQSAYQTAINAPVTFKNAAGVTSTYPSGNTRLINGMRARDMLAEVIAAGSSAWTLGKWLDTNNVAQTFTFADLQGLAAAMEAAITLDWSDLVTKIAEVNAATTVAEVQAITF